jgi:hypothetical protein
VKRFEGYWREDEHTPFTQARTDEELLDPRFWGPEPTRLTVIRSYFVGWLWGIKRWIRGRQQ